MKTCPFCKAEIQDNARFCLYCMRPLEEKQVVTPPKKRSLLWLWITVAVLALALLLLVILLPGQETPSAEVPIAPEVTAPETTEPETTEVPTETTDTPTETTDTPTETTEVTTQAPAEEQITPAVTESEIQIPNPTDPPVTTTTPETTAPPVTTPPTEPETTVPVTTIPETTQPVQTGSPVNPASAVVYSYRPAVSTDDLNANYTNPGNHIVITGVLTPSSNGEYIIPASIDGQRVISVDKFAFTGVSVRKILIENGVKNIADYSFSDCAALTDIYIAGTAVFISTEAFPQPEARNGILTFHCSADCHDRTYNFYKTGAAYWYGGAYEEWNG